MQSRSARAAKALFPMLLCGLAAACGSGIASPPTIATVVRVSGSGQTGPVGAVLSEPLIVRVEDQRGDPLAGGIINWAVTAGTGVVSPSADTTDATGQAQTSFRLGGSLGAQTVSATLPGLGPVTFTANAVAAPPSILLALAGNNQSGTVGATLPVALQVKVTDGFGNPNPGVAVSFTVIAGGGLVSASSVSTDTAGTARAFWTLGTEAGAQTIVAGVGALEPLVFSATASPDSPTDFQVLSGGNQVGNPGTPLQDSVVVRLVDQYGNGVSGLRVDWILGPNDGSVSPAATVSDAMGRTAVQWTLGLGSGPKTLIARTGSVQRSVNGAALAPFPGPQAIGSSR